MKHLVLLHGAMGSRSDFISLLPLLTAHYECHTLNFSGHGGEPFAPNAGIAQYARELDACLENLGLQEVDIFGYSMGGYVALYSSAKGNHRIRSVVCVGTKFLWNEEEARKQQPGLSPAFLKEKAPGYVEQLIKAHGENNWERLLSQTANMMTELGAGAGLTDAMLHAIDIPVVLAVGDKDRMVTKEETFDTAGKIKGAVVRVLENTPHQLERIDPNLLLSLLLK